MRTLIQLALRRPKLVVLAWLAMLAVAAPFASRLAGVLRGTTDAVPGSPSELASRRPAEEIREFFASYDGRP